MGPDPEIPAAEVTGSEFRADTAAAALARLAAAIDSLVSIDPTTFSAAELLHVLDGVETQSRRLPVVRQQLVAEIDTRGTKADHGCRTTADLMRKLLRLGPGEASTWVRHAARLTGGRSLSSGEVLPAELAEVAAAQLEGALSGEHVRLIIATMRRVPSAVGRAGRLQVERDLVAAARDHDPKRLAIIADRILAYVDPDGTLGRHENARHRRGLSIGLPGIDGLSRITGWLTPLARQALLSILEPLSAPNARHPENVATPEAPARADDRADATGQASRHDAGTAAPPTAAPPTAAPPTTAPPTTAPEWTTAANPGVPAAQQASDGGFGSSRPANEAHQGDRPPPGGAAADPPCAMEHHGVPTWPDEEDEGQHGGTASPPGMQLRDLRSAGQRLHDALAEACERLLAAGILPLQAGLPATILLIAQLRDLEAGLGVVSTAHGGTLPVPEVVRAAARARVIPAVFDTDGSPLWLGRMQRLASTAQRYALIARDRGCTMPGCDMPAWRCQVHHGPPWAPRKPGDPEGRTDVDQMALICGYDHHRIDDWSMSVVDGRVWWTPPPWIDCDRTRRTNTFFRSLPQ